MASVGRHFFSLALTMFVTMTSPIMLAAATNPFNEINRDGDSSQNAGTVVSMLVWRQNNVNSKSNFTVADIEQFFAPNFKIEMNGKSTSFTPKAYFDSLNRFKVNISSVSYEIDQFIDRNDSVVVPYLVIIESADKKSRQRLRVMAIFKFDDKNKITLWQEVYKLD